MTTVFRTKVEELDESFLASVRAAFKAGAAEPKLFERLVRLISETVRDPFQGIGKPEPLRHQLKGWWSRRIK